jgi:hypothetical protein
MLRRYIRLAYDLDERFFLLVPESFHMYCMTPAFYYMYSIAFHSILFHFTPFSSSQDLMVALYKAGYKTQLPDK